ncbi:DHHA1 domain-containing protein [Alkalihalophilus lindianensis]|uniref:DHHA1 domain-containing protein n=1 Tax=Alkalihalophilus lindianensis TaxID=1630542 RepID=A0ABU3X716_9BACI|nr:DHHA1 domain-containing protein [Alkalihalophilus lindianensis]MDV2683670.1 DHHA1 domain-containing protein [Alkalihalophilus lindianensis]
MTTKLYYQSAYTKTFEASVLKQDQDEQGVYIVLDQTVFYPTGGGQPSDTGLLNNQTITQVEEVEGEIRHYLEGALPRDVHTISGEINWSRRFDHMQQHTGQHILSAAFAELFGYETVGFHLGTDEVTIDLAIDELTKEKADQAVELANQIIAENRGIETKWVSEEEAASYPLRKKLSVSGDIRLVIIPDFDYNGCGGTHPKQTLEVQGISIIGWEKQRKNIRVSFVCGNRIVELFNKQNEVLKQLAQVLHAPMEKLPHAATNLLSRQQRTDKENVELKQELLTYEASELTNLSETVSNKPFVFQSFQDRPIKDMQQLARMIVDKKGNGIVFLVSESADKRQLVLACGQELEDMNASVLLKELLTEIDGRGGGNQTLAQGGGKKNGSVEYLVERIKRRIM